MIKKHCALLLVFLLSVSSVFSVQTEPTVQPPKDFENGLSAAMEAIKEYGLVDNADDMKRINDVGYRVAESACVDRPYISFRMVKMEEPNAFALPGGFIFVTSGMMDLGLTDDELAALLGHEITHVTHDHSRKMAKRQTLMNLLYEAMIVGIAVGIKDSNTYNPATGYYNRSNKSEILQGTQAFGLVFQELLLRGFSRELELDADHGGTIAAAGAGFSTQGTVQLFEKMRKKIYESPDYGYLRTHPYFEDRIGIARVLGASLESAKNPQDDHEYRVKTQQTFLDLLPRQKTEDQKRELRRMALGALPTGRTAEEVRLWFIKDAEDTENKQEPFYRDYGKILKLYQQNIDDVKDDPDSAGFVTKLQTRMTEIEKERDATKPLYEEVLAKSMFDTEMLKRYLSNFPDTSRYPEIQYRLAENYRALKKNPEAVDLYLDVLNGSQEMEWRQKSKDSLNLVVSNITDLSSCYKVAVDSKNTDLAKAADTRMKSLSASFDSMKNGYDFRRAYPASAYDKPVLNKMNELATEAVRQAKLYQAIGEYQKALDQYNQVLRYCPELPIADQVKDQIVDFQELSSPQS